MNIFMEHSNSNRLYAIWKAMRQKCQNPKNPMFKNFGGKGITVCQEWENFDVFACWALAKGFSGNHALLRYDEKKGFSPDNCYFTLKHCHHGFSQTKLYAQWRLMLERCHNESHKSFGDYGGRGISVCKEWKVFANYKNWALSHGYDEALTIDRIDVNGNYEPCNCRFVDMVSQCNNRRSSRFLTYQGKTLSHAQWARELGVSRSTIRLRVKRGLPIEEILRKEKHAHRGENHAQKLLTFNGVTLNQKQWAEKIGITPTSLMRRLKRMSVEEALSMH